MGYEHTQNIRFYLFNISSTLQRLLHEDVKPTDIDRFGEVVVGPFSHCLDCCLNRSMAGQNDQGRKGCIGLEGAKERDAVHLRHDKISDNEGRLEFRCLLQSLLTVSGDGHLISPACEEISEPLPRSEE